MALWRSKKKDAEKAQELGVDAFESGDIKTALKAFTAAIDLEPTSERYYYRGVIHDMSGKPKKAASDLRDAVELEPSNAPAWYSLSIVYFQQELTRESYDAVKRAHELAPDDFRIVNHYAQFLANSPVAEHVDPPRAVELAKHACELTEWKDEICLTTYKDAMEAAGDSEGVADIQEKLEEVDDRKEEDLTFQLIRHFEQKLGKKANELALQNIVPDIIPIAVQTIENVIEGSGDTIAFTTGMSTIGMRLPPEERDMRFAELMMLIPNDWDRGEGINEQIWPWHSLQQLANLTHMTGQGYGGMPMVVTPGDEPESVGGSEFVAFLLIPRLTGYIEPYVSRSERIVNFIVVVPIYREEYELAVGPSGPIELLKRFSENELAPRLTPGRPNLG